jgi:hypothetical protein
MNKKQTFLAKRFRGNEPAENWCERIEAKYGGQLGGWSATTIEKPNIQFTVINPTQTVNSPFQLSITSTPSISISTAFLVNLTTNIQTPLVAEYPLLDATNIIFNTLSLPNGIYSINIRNTNTDLYTLQTILSSTFSVISVTPTQTNNLWIQAFTAIISSNVTVSSGFFRMTQSPFTTIPFAFAQAGTTITFAMTLPYGAYEVVFTDQFGSEASFATVFSTLNVSSVTPLSFNETDSTTLIISISAPDRAAAAVVRRLTAPFTQTPLTFIETGSTLTGAPLMLPAGTYAVDITDTNNRVASFITLTSKAQVISCTPSTVNADTLSTFTLTLSSAVPIASVAFNGPTVVTPSFTQVSSTVTVDSVALPLGTYTLAITDTNTNVTTSNVQVQSIFRVTQVVPQVIVHTVPTPVTLTLSHNVQIQSLFVPTLLSVPFTQNTTNVNTTLSLPVGTHTARLIDSQGNQNTFTPVHCIPAITALTPQNTFDDQSSTYTITLSSNTTMSSGFFSLVTTPFTNVPFSFTQSGDTITTTSLNLPNGSYRVNLVDDNSNIITSTQTVTSQFRILTFSPLTTTDANSQAFTATISSNKTISMLSFGTIQMAFTQTGTNISVPSVLVPYGVYTVTMTDNTGVTNSFAQTVRSNLTILNVNPLVVPVTTSSSFTVTVSAGSIAQVRFVGSTTINASFAQAGQTLTLPAVSLPVGAYTLQVTDTNTNTVTFPQQVEAIPSVVTVAPTQVLENVSSAYTLTMDAMATIASGFFQLTSSPFTQIPFTFTQSGTTINVTAGTLPYGNYNIRLVTGANLITAAQTVWSRVNIIAITPLLVNNTSSTLFTATITSATTVSQARFVLLNTSNFVVTNLSQAGAALTLDTLLPTGQYSLRITDSNGNVTDSTQIVTSTFNVTSVTPLAVKHNVNTGFSAQISSNDSVSTVYFQSLTAPFTQYPTTFTQSGSSINISPLALPFGTLSLRVLDPFNNIRSSPTIISSIDITNISPSLGYDATNSTYTITLSGASNIVSGSFQLTSSPFTQTPFTFTQSGTTINVNSISLPHGQYFVNLVDSNAVNIQSLESVYIRVRITSITPTTSSDTASTSFTAVISNNKPVSFGFFSNSVAPFTQYNLSLTQAGTTINVDPIIMPAGRYFFNLQENGFTSQTSTALVIKEFTVTALTPVNFTVSLPTTFNIQISSAILITAVQFIVQSTPTTFINATSFTQTGTTISVPNITLTDAVWMVFLTGETNITSGNSTQVTQPNIQLENSFPRAISIGTPFSLSGTLTSYSNTISTATLNNTPSGITINMQQHKFNISSGVVFKEIILYTIGTYTLTITLNNGVVILSTIDAIAMLNTSTGDAIGYYTIPTPNSTSTQYQHYNLLNIAPTTNFVSYELSTRTLANTSTHQPQTGIMITTERTLTGNMTPNTPGTQLYSGTSSFRDRSRTGINYSLSNKFAEGYAKPNTTISTNRAYSNQNVLFKELTFSFKEIRRGVIYARYANTLYTKTPLNVFLNDPAIERHFMFEIQEAVPSLLSTTILHTPVFGTGNKFIKYTSDALSQNFWKTVTAIPVRNFLSTSSQFRHFQLQLAIITNATDLFLSITSTPTTTSSTEPINNGPQSNTLPNSVTTRGIGYLRSSNNSYYNQNTTTWIANPADMVANARFIHFISIGGPNGIEIGLSALNTPNGMFASNGENRFPNNNGFSPTTDLERCFNVSWKGTGNISVLLSMYTWIRNTTYSDGGSTFTSGTTGRWRGVTLVHAECFPSHGTSFDPWYMRYSVPSGVAGYIVVCDATSAPDSSTITYVDGGTGSIPTAPFSRKSIAIPLLGGSVLQQDNTLTYQSTTQAGLPDFTSAIIRMYEPGVVDIASTVNEVFVNITNSTVLASSTEIHIEIWWISNGSTYNVNIS